MELLKAAERAYHVFLRAQGGGLLYKQYLAVEVFLEIIVAELLVDLQIV